jgi:hypothetical protein
MSEAKGEYEFVELNRTFYELSKNAGGSDDNEIHRAFGKSLSWPDLNQDYRVIVLSEAGTGKTAEIRHVANTLRKEGKAAFFLRLEHIPIDFEDAFEVGSFEEFQAWLASGDEGWLLLDSVDEARLRNPNDFELAIRKLGRIITDAQQRVHIIITGRTIAWRPKTDLDHCERHLPYASPRVTVATVEETAIEDDSDQDFHTKDQSERKIHSFFQIVALNDLDSDQIRAFAVAKGINDSQAFLDAVERADAWSFTARPQDLQELVEFWNDHGKIGSRLEIMQNSIDRRLLERDQGRADASPISPVRMREGARLVAAAVTLSQEPTIRVPDGADNSKGIPIADILPDWNDRERAILLSRPIFDEAIYGTVRFHHRSVREYLTAEWLNELLKRETSRRKIEALFFRNQYGLDVVVPTMRPVLPWLAILDDKIRKRIGQVAPEVLLEGGDSSKLPLETRRHILRQVCDQIATGLSIWAVTGNTAVQRFANKDIVADIKELIGKHATNDDIILFLLRMVWLGELKDALPEAKAYAVSTSSSQYTRIAAIHAVRAVGSPEDMEWIRTRFLSEGVELNRELLEELLDNLAPTVPSINWLLDCLAKTEMIERYRVDGLLNAVVAFVQRADIELVPNIVSGLNNLLDTPPVLERQHWKISQKFGWLISAAARAIERLLETRHPASLESDALAILHKCGIARRNGVHNFDEKEFSISTLMPAWPEINRTSFWYEAKQALEHLNRENGETLTEFWQVSVYGSFWKFENADFEYAVEQIAERSLLEERILALSLAFRLYVMGGRNRKQREMLKRAVAGDSALAERLARYLKPPAQGRQKWKRMEARWKRNSEAKKQMEAKNREEWRTFLRANPQKLRDNKLKPGEISKHQWYLYEITSEKNSRSNRWTSGDWKCLTDEFGEEVARAYRDGAVRFWRGYKPELQSEGAPANTTPYAVIFGLTGLEIEAIETNDWPNGLSTKEVGLACRYASHELNGFPNWFPTLFAKYPEVISDFLLKEIHYELSIEKADVESNYILSDVSWSGRWAWDKLAPNIYKILETKEPGRITTLDRMLNIVQGSSISDQMIANLASEKCKILMQSDHAAYWFAVWSGVDADSAIPCLEERFEDISSVEDRTAFAIEFINHLLGSRRSSVSNIRTGFRTPEYLKRLYLLMHQHIRAKEDIKRGPGGFSPGLRDDAQSARETLAELLRNIPGKDAFIALMEIARLHPEEAHRPWFDRQAKTKAETDADITAWSPRQVRDFHDQLERTPANHRELAELAHFRLLDLKDDIEEGDNSFAKLLQKIELETDMRKYIGGVLREKASGRYSIPQEEELADAKKPDLRFHGANFDGPVPVELKLADNWTGPQLLERMENQLCGDYLRDNRSNRGFFVLVYQGKKKHWEIPDVTEQVDFIGLIGILENYWQKIALNYPRVDHIQVIGIDLTKRAK